MRSASGHRRSGWISLGLLAALVLRAQGVPLLLPGCPLRTLTGIPCPTCFLTRSALATLHGDLGEALELHLFGPPLLLGLGWVGWRQGVLGRDLPRLGASGWLVLLGLGSGLGFYWILRLTLWFVLDVSLPA